MGDHKHECLQSLFLFFNTHKIKCIALNKNTVYD